MGISDFFFPAAQQAQLQKQKARYEANKPDLRNKNTQIFVK